MNPTTFLVDVRQTPAYATFMKKIGWQVKKIKYQSVKGQGSSDYTSLSKLPFYIYIKKLPLCPFSVIKILRCPWPIQLNKLIKLIKKYKPLFIKIHPFTTKKQINLKLENLLIKKFRIDKHPLIPTKTIWFDLKKSKTELYSAMNKKVRYSIRFAQKEGIKTIVVPGNNLKSHQLLEFFSIWSKNKPYNWLFKPSFKELNFLISSFKDKCFFVLAYSSQLISGVLVLTSNHLASDWYGTNTNLGRKLLAKPLVLWEAIKESKKRGLKIFDFEGIYDSRFPKTQKGWQGFTKFKKGFGGQEIEFFHPIIINPAWRQADSELGLL